MPARAHRERSDVYGLVRGLPPEELREILCSAVDCHPDVERHVLLAAARSEGDLGELRREVDRGLRTRRFLDYRESSPKPARHARSWGSCASPRTGPRRRSFWRWSSGRSVTS